MAAEQRNKVVETRTVMTAVNMIVLILGLAYVALVTVSGYNGALWYKLSLMIVMMGYSVMFNIAALHGMDAFGRMKREQARSYCAYMIFDAVELCFLAMFVVNAADFDEPFHYISLGIFVILTIPRHILYHSAVDGIKEAGGQKEGRYHTVTAMEGFVESKNAKEKFPKPKLREDRFVNMKLDEMEGYVDVRSVDDRGNVDMKGSKESTN